MAIDPICEMECEENNYSYEYAGKKYHFCSQGCLDAFKQSPDEYFKKKEHQLIIIGGGPAGLTAAVYSSVFKIPTFLISMDIGGQAIDSIKIKNYMGFDFISGKDLTNKFKEQFLHEHYLDHKIDEVLSINKKGELFEVITKSGGKYSAQSIIIASGMKRRKLNVLGEDRLQRKGIFYSSAHDITFCKGSNVVVVGGGNSGVQTANNLKNIGCHVTLVSKGKLIADKHDIEELQGCKDVEILEGYNVSEISGEDKVEGVSLISQDGSSKIEKRIVGIFIQIGFLPNTELCEDKLKLNNRGEIIIKPDCSTNVKGIFACGDVTDAFGKRIIVAAGEGAKAALSAKQYLIESGRECR